MYSPDNVSVFREFFRRHAGGVTVITATSANGTPVGFTATSLASLALNPPLATFNMSQSASSWSAVATGEFVAVHQLGIQNHAVAKIVSGDHRLRFQGDHWHTGPHGLPIVNEVSALFIGRIVARHPQSGSAVVVLEVEGGEIEDAGHPLLYYRRQYWVPGDPA